MKKAGKLLGAGVFSAIAASLCCITPVLALISGASGAASAFSWMEPYRPYLIGLTALVLGFAWYQKLKPRTAEEIQCDCEEDEKPSFWQSKKFLGIITVFSIVMLAFPYYGHIFYPKSEQQTIIIASDDIKEISFSVEGMTCASCEEHVKHAVNQLPGIVAISANYADGSASVKFDDSKTDKATIIKAIDKTGYTVSGEKTPSANPPHGEQGHTCGPNGCK